MKDEKEPDWQPIGNSKTPNLADIVMSNNGRDAGKKLIVIEKQENYSLIVDGKGRRCEQPKLKKDKHLTIIGRASGIVEDKLTSGDKVTNNEVRRALAKYEAESDVQEV